MISPSQSASSVSDELINLIYKSGNWSLVCFLSITFLFQLNGSFILYSPIFTSAHIDFICNQNNYTNNLLNNTIINNCYVSAYLNKSNSIKCSDEKIEFLPKPNYVKNSIISDFKLICDKKYYDELIQSLLILGIFIGGIVGPVLGDRYGRLYTCFITMFISGIFGILIIFVESVILLAVFKLLLGILREISGTNGVILALEYIPSKRQALFGFISELFYCATIVLIGLIGYVCRDWKYLQVIGSIPALFGLFALIFISESPRWLLNRRKMDKLKVTISKYVVKFNRIELNKFEGLFVKFDQIYETSNNIELGSITKNPNNISILQNYYLLFWIFILIVTWIQVVITMISMNFIITFIVGNAYLNLIISGILDSVGLFIGYLLLRKSRLFGVVVLQLVSSTSIILSGLVLENNYPIITRVLMIMGKSCVIGVSFVINLTSLYIYPSQIRTLGSCGCMAVGKLCAVLSPYLIELYRVNQRAASMIIWISSVLVLIINIWYPEWVNKPFPETAEDLRKLKQTVIIKRLINGVQESTRKKKNIENED